MGAEPSQPRLSRAGGYPAPAIRKLITSSLPARTQRSFAAAAKKGKKAAAKKGGAAIQQAELPATLYGVGGRYAGALFQSASNASALSTVEADLANMVDLVDGNETFKTYLANPTIAKPAKKADIEAIMKDTVGLVCRRRFLPSSLLPFP